MAAFIKKTDMARGYQKRPSICAYLPWRDYNEQQQIFLLEDQQLAACFQLTPIACEARPKAMMEAIAHAIQETLSNSITCEKNNPWILQCFVQRENNLSFVVDKVTQAIPAARENERLVQAHLATLKSHLDYVTRPNGIFKDTQVTQQVFQGGILTIHAVLYRRHTTTKKNTNLRRTAMDEIIRIAQKLTEQWRACGLGVQRLNGDAFYRWLAKWFNPNPKQTQGNAEKLLTEIKFPAITEKPFGWDFTEQLFFSAPESFEQGWLFDDMPHKVITIQSLSANPAIGHLTAERKRGTDDKVFQLIDHLPEGSIFSMAIVMQAQSEVELHLKKIYDSAVGRHALAMKVKTEIDNAQQAIADGDYLLPLVMAVYIRGKNMEQLHAHEAQVEVLLNSNGFKVITDDEVYPIDAYLRYLPMCYDWQFDQKNNYRSRYALLSDIAKLLPFYGRSRGTENPGMLMFNRGGEPWRYDLLKDKTKNAHFLLLGETGTGKSNTLNSLIMQTLALYNPRFFILEAGGSFDLLADYCQHLGLTIHKVKIDPKRPIALNPFAEGLKIIDQIEAIELSQRERWLAKEEARLENDINNTATEEEAETRDILGDMLLAALVMITGGEKKEEERIRRSDRMLIMDAILSAAYTVKASERDQLIAADIVEAFETITLDLNPQRDAQKIRRAREMADSMRYFIKDPVSSQFFNTVGDPWPLVDITVVDFGLFAQEGYDAQRSIAFCGVFSKIQTLAEANQYSHRALISVLDENHIFSKLPLLAAMETRGAKMGRKLGWWLWIATQNLKDFADEARKMLAMIETWMCLALPPDEIDQIERFKPLTEEQRALFLSARKEKGKYTEGVLLSPRVQGLFRSVPARLYLAMAATEQDEKHQRRELMRTLGISEMAAVEHIAKQMMQIHVEVQQ